MDHIRSLSSIYDLLPSGRGLSNALDRCVDMLLSVGGLDTLDMRLSAILLESLKREATHLLSLLFVVVLDLCLLLVCAPSHGYMHAVAKLFQDSSALVLDLLVVCNFAAYQ